MSDADVQQLLLEYRDVLALGGWQQPATWDELGEGVSVWYNVVKGWCSVLLELEVSCPLEWLRLALRPETFHRFPEIAQGLFVYDSVDITAPGDALLRFRVNMEQDGSRRLRNFLNMGLGPDDDGCQKCRLCVRMDVPHAGAFSRILLPIRGGHRNATITVLRQGQSPGTTSVTYMIRDPLPAFCDGHMAHCKAVLTMTRKWIVVICEKMPTLLLPVQRHYVTLALRSCARGPPLLPLPEPSCHSTQVPVGEHFWAPMETTGFTFSRYLSALLWALGCPAQIYCSMYGQSLVPYQVVVVRDEWERIRPTFNKEFSAQRSAYRLLNGGNGAPKVFEDVEQRFLHEPRAQLLSPAYLDVHDLQLLRSEKNTFLEFTELRPEEPAAVRAKEYP